MSTRFPMLNTLDIRTMNIDIRTTNVWAMDQCRDPATSRANAVPKFPARGDTALGRQPTLGGPPPVCHHTTRGLLAMAWS